ncbi:MAG: leucine-rich repeat domain-containing protein [Clostridia bacterium]|nr:leucine-rich repeat domain-containing protein [Clostridia bacterium]
MEISDSVISIGDRAFDYCHSLIEVINKSSLKIVAGSKDYGYIGYNAKHIITDGSQSALKTVGDYLFYDDGTDKYLVKYLGSDTDIILPEYDGEKEYGIWSGAFYENDAIISVVMPDSVTSIGYRAFEYCTSLTSVTIGNGVTSIGTLAFDFCKSLTSITIPDSVMSIGTNAFEECTSLISVTIGKSVTSIGVRAFYDCYSLTSLTIPNSVTSIGDYAFYYCTSLTSITIPDSVTSIGYYAFENCSKLTIYCEAEAQPSGWRSKWNYSNRPVVWGYKPEE